MKEIDWERLIRFIGYGPERHAKILFLGLEEKAREGERNLLARGSFEEIEDLYEAHVKLGRAGCRNPFKCKESHSPVKPWNIAARLALALQGLEWRNRAIWGDYWRSTVGQHSGSTFLMECSPFPRSNRSSKLSIPPGWTEERYGL